MTRPTQQQIDGLKTGVTTPDGSVPVGDGGDVAGREDLLARTIYQHFAEFEGMHPDEAADSTGALLYSLQMVGIVGGSMPEPGNGGRVAATPTLPHGDLTPDEVREWFPDDAAEDALRAEDWFQDADMGSR